MIQRLGLYYLQSRYYDPQWGRYLNADYTTLDAGAGLLRTNMYLYCANNPINMSDPTGKAVAGAIALQMLTPTTTAATAAVATVTAVQKQQLKTNPVALTYTGNNTSTYASQSDASVIARLIYGESSNQTGQQAVARVLINRENDTSGLFANTFRGIALQSGQFASLTGTAQDTNRARNPVASSTDWDSAVQISISLMSGDYGSIPAPAGINNQLYFVSKSYFDDHASTTYKNASNVKTVAGNTFFNY